MLSVETRENVRPRAPVGASAVAVALRSVQALGGAADRRVAELSTATRPSLRLGPLAATTALRDAMRPGLKRAMDLCGAAVLLLACLPALLTIALLVRRDGGPVFYAHERVGRGGRRFGCLKFRSMVVDADRRLSELLTRDPGARAEWDATRKLRDDPRVTPIGRFLRATSLDELPQLINVLRGEMSLVGPRPVIGAELERHYGPVAAALYLSVRPGITGPWQVSGRSDTTYASRVALDAAYASNPSLWTDLSVLARTPIAVLLRRGAY